MTYIEKMVNATGYQTINNIKTIEEHLKPYDEGERNVDSLVETLKYCMKIYDYELITEYIMCINWKSWEHYELGHEKLSRAYASAFYELQDVYLDFYEDNEEALAYYYSTTD